MCKTDLLLSFVSLKQLEDNNIPINMASGCIINYNNRHFLLTVFHAVGNQGKWALDLKYKHPEMKMYPLNGFVFLIKTKINTPNIDDVDFAVKEIDKSIIPYYQEIESNAQGNIIQEIPKYIYNTDFTIEPSLNKIYSFAGLTQPNLGEYSQDKYFLEQTLSYEKNMSFLGSINDGDIYVFKLSRQHQGHKYYQGCSGSPILDDDGNIVSLVTGGNEEKNEIYGINVSRYKVVLDVILMGIDI